MRFLCEWELGLICMVICNGVFDRPATGGLILMFRKTSTWLMFRYGCIPMVNSFGMRNKNDSACPSFV